MSTTASTNPSMQFAPEWLQQPRKQPSYTSLNDKSSIVTSSSQSQNISDHTGPTYSSLVGGTQPPHHDGGGGGAWNGNGNGALAVGGVLQPTSILPSPHHNHNHSHSHNHNHNHNHTHNPNSTMSMSNINVNPGHGPANLFRYSKEQMLGVWKQGGGRAPLGLEVERWPGIVRDHITEPVGLRELSPEERKIFVSQSLNSTPTTRGEPTLRRRTTGTNNGGGGIGGGNDSNAGTPTTPTGAGGRGGPFNGGLGTPRSVNGASPGGGSLLTKRRKDDTGDTPAPVGVYRPRQLSLSTADPITLAPGFGALPSPRRGLAPGGGIEGVLGNSWMGMRRRASDKSVLSVNTSTGAAALLSGGALASAGVGVGVGSGVDNPPLLDESHEGAALHGDLAPPVEIHSRHDVDHDHEPVDRRTSPMSISDDSGPSGSGGGAEDASGSGTGSNSNGDSSQPLESESTARTSTLNSLEGIGLGLPSSLHHNGTSRRSSPSEKDRLGGGSSAGPFHQQPMPSVPNEAVQWRYKDEQGQVQGPFPSESMHAWFNGGYFQDHLLIQRYEPPYDPLHPNDFEPLANYKRKLPPTLEQELFKRGMELTPRRPPNLPTASTPGLNGPPGLQAPMSGIDSPLAPESRSASATQSGTSNISYQNEPAPAPALGPSLGSGSAFLNGGIPRNIVAGRQGSFDTFGASPSPLNSSSPALSNGLAQSFGNAAMHGFVDHSHVLSNADRERQEREQYFKSLRELELGGSHVAPGPHRANSLDQYGGAPGGSPFGSGPFGNGLGAIGNSPSFAQASPIGGYGHSVVGGSGGQIPAPIGPGPQASAYHSAFPRPGFANPGSQPGSVPQSPFQSHPSGSAWNNAPGGHLARHLGALAPQPPAAASISPLDNQSAHHQPDAFASWGVDSRSQDPFQQPFDQGSNIWPGQRGGFGVGGGMGGQGGIVDQRSAFGGHGRNKGVPDASMFYNLGTRYSTATALRMAQAPTEANLNLQQQRFGTAEPPQMQQPSQIAPQPVVAAVQESVSAPVAVAIPTPAPALTEPAVAQADLSIPALATSSHAIDELVNQLQTSKLEIPVEVTEKAPQTESPISAIAPQAPQTTIPAPLTTSIEVSSPANAEPSAPLPESDPIPAVVAKPVSQRKASSATKVTSVSMAAPTTTTSSTTLAPAPSLPSPDASVAASTSMTSKAPWASATPSASVPASSTTTSLREIQEAESKRSDARKEKEKAQRAAALAAAATTVSTPQASTTEEPALPKTTSWGLSQAGQAKNVKTSGSAAVTPTVMTPTTSANVWSTAAPKASTTKSMKEIVEEEEKRKKAQAKAQSAVLAASVAAAAAVSTPSGSESTGRKAYVDSAKAGETKALTPAVAAAWTTVGLNGKPVQPTVPLVLPASLPPKPQTVMVPSASSSKVATPSIAIPTPPKPTSVTSVVSPSVKKPAVDDRATQPSTELIKWTREALKGLTGVNMEDFITMLFDFPLDPDASTMEIISDSVYANSKTLDGRRFASEFVAKRKADVVKGSGSGASIVVAGGSTSGSVGSSSGSGGWGKSVAEVVKAQPKVVEKDWGYKVVKKKGKKN